MQWTIAYTRHENLVKMDGILNVKPKIIKLLGGSIITLDLAMIS